LFQEKKVEGKIRMNTIEQIIKNGELCVDCMSEVNITLGECENIYYEYNFKTVLHNGSIVEFEKITEAN
jgi:hypothetical protein